MLRKLRADFLCAARGAGGAVLLLAILGMACHAPISVHRTPAPVPPALATLPSPPSNHSAWIFRTLDEVEDRAGSPSATSADRELYNYLVARAIESMLTADGELPDLDQGGAASALADPYVIQFRYLPVLAIPGARLIAADTLRFEGRYAEYRAVRDGIGAPFVVQTPKDPKGAVKVIEYQPTTATARFRGTSVTFEFHDPYQVDADTVAGTRMPLAADFGAPISLLLSTERIDRLGLARLLRPSRYNDTARLSQTQPYDEARIPVLFVHGLQDTPATWVPMYLNLLDDPEIRERYQFWVFSYPSGYPYPYSAWLLREQMETLLTLFPRSQDMVIIGHSMGGMISRLMVTDARDSIWTEVFGSNPQDSQIFGNSRELLEESIVFDAREEVDRAIFICTPHRGSELASNWIGRIGSRLVRLPAFMADARDAMWSLMTLDPSALVLKRAPNSIDTLAPDNRFLQAVNRLPIATGVPYHSIVGDRGKGDTPNSSDGVVAYWSSHLPGALSEKIVPSGHGGHQDPEGIAEVRRILRLHAGLSATPEP